MNNPLLNPAGRLRRGRSLAEPRRRVQCEHEPSCLREGVEPPICDLSMSLDGSLSIRVNGEHRRVPGGTSVAEMVNLLGLDPLRVAVERNLEVIPRSTLEQVCVEDGDDYEIVHFVGGG